MTEKSARWALIGIQACLLLSSVCLLAQQQRPMIPDKYTNLKLLPKDIQKPELLKIMKGFSTELGVRCRYCHDATDDLSQADFPSDVKPTKLSARVMMEMTRDANESLRKMPEPAASITCLTCHRHHAKMPFDEPPSSPATSGTSPHP